MFFPLLSYVLLIVVNLIVLSVYREYIGQWFMLDFGTYMNDRFQKLWLESKTYYFIELTRPEQRPDPRQGVLTNGPGWFGGGADINADLEQLTPRTRTNIEEERNRDNLDNPDQRIAEDAQTFCLMSWDLFMHFLRGFVKMGAYIPLVYSRSPHTVFGEVQLFQGWLVCAVLLYSILGTLLVHFSGKIFIPLDFVKQRVQADYRFAMTDIRRHSETVAMMDAEHRERVELKGWWRVQWRGGWGRF